ncbi:hypothetical protein EDB89DRAFT_2203541, partial [Lactarius sanguifluus]
LLSRRNFENWSKERETTPSEKSAHLARLVDTFINLGQPDKAYYYKLVHIRLLDPASQATKLVELDAIPTALSDPAIFDFDQLFKKRIMVLALRTHLLFALLWTLLSGGPDDLHVWQQPYGGIWYVIVAQIERWVIGGKLSIRPTSYQLFSFLPGE